MADRNTDALIISDGGLASLVAVWREANSRSTGPAAATRASIRSELQAVIRGEPHPGATVFCPAEVSHQGRNAAAKQAEISGMVFVSSAQMGRSDGVSVDDAGSLILLQAAAAAAERGLSRVIWPVQLGGGGTDGPTRIEDLATAADRAVLVSQLAGLDLPRQGGPGALAIETPLLALTDSRLLELALDLDAPIPRPLARAGGFDSSGNACWWCERDAAGMCGWCGPCRRWGAAWKLADPSGLLVVGRQ